jgi:hypothetical protein
MAPLQRHDSQTERVSGLVIAERLPDGRWGKTIVSRGFTNRAAARSFVADARRRTTPALRQHPARQREVRPHATREGTSPTTTIVVAASGSASSGSSDRPRSADEPEPPLAQRHSCAAGTACVAPTPWMQQRSGGRGRRREYHGAECRKAAFLARETAKPPKARKLVVCPSCGDYCARLDEWTGWCKPCTRDFNACAAVAA